jgi:NAD+ diphosphatase
MRGMADDDGSMATAGGWTAFGPRPDDLDRAHHRRGDDAWLERMWRRAGSKVVRVGPDGVDLAPDGHGICGPGGHGPRPEVFLGLDADGHAVFADLAIPSDDDSGAGDGTGTSRASRTLLRQALGRLDPAQARIAAYASALARWHERHPFCPQCGAATLVAQGGHVRRCPACARDHHPRTDSAVIVLVTDDDDRALLGRQASWPAGRFSTLAGFVEAGEGLEAAVVREVAEESGVVVDDVRYVASQPWPFPASLMLGFLARARSTAITVDGIELEEARWFSRAALTAATTTGEVVLPPASSISRALIDAWHGGDLGSGPFLTR